LRQRNIPDEERLRAKADKQLVFKRFLRDHVGRERAKSLASVQGYPEYRTA
jgi:hypothetical protein